MVETVSAQPLPAKTQGGTASQALEPGTELRAKVEANLPGGVVRLSSDTKSIDLRVPSPLPVGSNVTLSVSGTRQQPAVVLTPDSAAAKPATPAPPQNTGQTVAAQPTAANPQTPATQPVTTAPPPQANPEGPPQPQQPGPQTGQQPPQQQLPQTGQPAGQPQPSQQPAGQPSFAAARTCIGPVSSGNRGAAATSPTGRRCAAATPRPDPDSACRTGPTRCTKSGSGSRAIAGRFGSPPTGATRTTVGQRTSSSTGTRGRDRWSGCRSANHKRRAGHRRSAAALRRSGTWNPGRSSQRSIRPTVHGLRAIRDRWADPFARGGSASARRAGVRAAGDRGASLWPTRVWSAASWCYFANSGADRKFNSCHSTGGQPAASRRRGTTAIAWHGTDTDRTGDTTDRAAVARRVTSWGSNRYRGARRSTRPGPACRGSSDPANWGFSSICNISIRASASGARGSKCCSGSTGERFHTSLIPARSATECGDLTNSISCRAGGCRWNRSRSTSRRGWAAGRGAAGRAGFASARSQSDCCGSSIEFNARSWDSGAERQWSSRSPSDGQRQCAIAGTGLCCGKTWHGNARSAGHFLSRGRFGSFNAGSAGGGSLAPAFGRTTGQPRQSFCSNRVLDVRAGSRKGLRSGRGSKGHAADFGTAPELRTTDNRTVPAAGRPLVRSGRGGTVAVANRRATVSCARS